MNKLTFKYVLPTLFVGAQTFAGMPTKAHVIQKMDIAISKVNKDKVIEFCKSTNDRFEEAYKSKNNSIWDQLLREINESSIDGLQGEVGFTQSPLHINFSYDGSSRYFAPNVHAGQDRFSFSLGLIFPMAKDSGLDLGFNLNETRDVSFTRLYPTKCTSLVRLPYNPISRMPVDAEKAIELEEGELVSYSAPFTVSLGARVSDGIAGAGLTYFRTADVNVNIFRMQNKHVRVRMVARQEKGLNFSGRALEKMAGVIRIADVRAELVNSAAKAILIDYIFNLNDESARETYRQLVSPHDFSEFNKDSELEKVKVAFLNDSKKVKTMFIDELAILKQAQSNSANVIRIMGSEADLISNRFGFNINFLNAVKLVQKVNYTDASIRRTDENSNVINDFFTRTIETITQSKFFSLASKDNYQVGTILTDQKLDPKTNIPKTNPLGFLLQKHSNKQELNGYSQKRWSVYLKNLPMTADHPNIDAELQAIRQGGRMQTREMFFVDYEEFAQNTKGLSEDYLKNKIREIFLQSIDLDAMLTSEATGVDSAGVVGINSEMNKRLVHFRENPKLWNQLSREKKLTELTWIYSYELNSVIGSYLVKISNESLPGDQRLLAFNALMQTPLFNEIGINLLSRIIPRNQLANTVIYEVLMQSNKDSIRPLLVNYGDISNKNYVTGQNGILTKNFSLDPGSELRIYLKVDGTLKSVADILNEVKLSPIK